MSSRNTSVAAIAAVLLIATALPVAQSRPPVPSADYGQWETLIAQPRATTTGPLSPDGQWLVYGITRSNRQHELRVVNTTTGRTVTAAFGEAPLFSADSKWMAYGIGVSEAEEEKLQKDRKPVRKKLGLLNLGSGDIDTIDNIESFAFSADGSHLAMRTYPPEPPRGERPAGDASAGSEPAADAERDKPGSTFIVRSLGRESDMTFGHVTDFAWQTKGPLLAFTIGVEGRTGNGVHLYNPVTGALRVLDSAEASYTGLGWRTDADDLVVLRSKSDPLREGSTHVVLAWRGLAQGGGQPRVLDPTAGALARDQRIIAARKPEWARDGQRIFVGIAAWDEKPDGEKGDGQSSAVDDNAGVDVWHWRDIEVMPLQKRRAAADRQRSRVAAWTLTADALVPLAATHFEEVRILDTQPRALIIDRAPSAMERSFGRPSASVSLVDLTTGARTLVKDRLEDRYLQASPDGRYLLYFVDDHYWVYNVAAGTHRNITKAIPTSFTDRESDATIKQKPPFGAAGWTIDSASVLLYDRFDVWDVPVDGGGAVRLTQGASDEVRHRYARLDPEERFIDRSKPLYFSLFGEWTKRSGYARLRPGAPGPERTVWLDKRVDRLTKAKEADVYVYAVQAFDDSPDYFLTSAALTEARQVTTTNPFQEKYAWGRAELVEYKTARGERLQGALHYPAGYDAAKKYPMVVYMYEQLSDGLHAYSSPSERQPYNAAVFTSQGYFFFQPDIVFRPRDPGLSVIECVVPAVKAVIQKGAVDSRRIGIVGHSWGGFDTVFLATHTPMFAAAVAGAPITNLVSNYGNHHWSQGIAETDHIETGQQRMEVPLWEDLQAYIRNSAVFGVHTMTTPLLVAFGENDGTVHWHQGVELYNIARRAGKPVVMLAYAGEDHGLRRRANQLDYHRRILQWFGHYLKGDAPAEWMEKGVSALERERELKRRRPAGTTSGTKD
jgi:dipeptidyl aminopeptidase/acylaminoacyl peptidase